MTTSNESAFLTAAINKVTGMLKAKDKIWAFKAPTFENFDIHRAFGVEPIQWGLTMCNLKLNRLKKRWIEHQDPATCHSNFAKDKDVEDTLIDLASYAILTLGLVYREQANGSEVQTLIDAYIDTTDGKAEIEKLARELMGDKACPPPQVGPQRGPTHEEIARKLQGYPTVPMPKSFIPPSVSQPRTYVEKSFGCTVEGTDGMLVNSPAMGNVTVTNDQN